MKALAWMLDPTFVSQRVLPVVYAFAVGVVVALNAQDRATAAALHKARQRADVAERRLLLTLTACEPLLSLPPESTPELIAARPRGPVTYRLALVAPGTEGDRHGQ